MNLGIDQIASGLVLCGLLWLTLNIRVEKNRRNLIFFAYPFLWLCASGFDLALREGLLVAILPSKQMGLLFPFTAYLSSLVLYLSTLTLVRQQQPVWRKGAFGLIWGVLLWVVGFNPNGIFLDQFAIGAWIFDRGVVCKVVLQISWIVASILAAGLTLRARKQAIHPLHRNRYLFWYSGLLLHLLGVGTVISALGNAPITQMAMLLSAGWLEFTLLRHKLPDLKQFLRRVISLVLTASLSVLLYAVALYFLPQWVKTPQGIADGIFQIALAAVGLALLVNPLLRLLQKGMVRVILRNYSDPNQIIGEYSRQISNIIELEKLSQAITASLTLLLRVRHVRLFWVNETRQGFVLQEISTAERTSLLIAPDSPIAWYFAVEHAPLAQYDVDLLPRFKNTPPSEREALRDQGFDLYLPIFGQNRWIGLMGLGNKRSGDRFFESEFSLLETLAEHTGVSLENARLYEDLKTRSAENERLNQELTTANAELARLDKAKSDFINIASHELRTPLTQIIGYNDIMAAMASGGSMTPDISQQMSTGIKKAARRLAEIIDSMFDLSRLDVDALELELSPISIATTVANAVDKWREASESRRITLAIAPGLKDLPLTYADGNRLTQVFSHLIQNAIKATPDGGVIQVAGTCNQDLAGKAILEITVSDAGVGIAPEELERIFEKFYRTGDVMLHSTGASKFNGAGAGLGLAICRGIVQAHQGKIWAESSGHDEHDLPGAKFHVQLPVVPIIHR